MPTYLKLFLIINNLQLLKVKRNLNDEYPNVSLLFIKSKTNFGRRLDSSLSILAREKM